MSLVSYVKVFLCFVALGVICEGSITEQNLHVTLSFKTNDGLKVSDESEEAVLEEEEVMIIDRPKGEEEIGPLGQDYGDDIGIGPAEGVRCLLERPRGEDGLQYCEIMTPEKVQQTEKYGKELIVLSLGEKDSDAQKRLERSASTYKYKFQRIEAPTTDPSKHLQFLRDEISKLNSDKSDKIILFINGSNAILSSGPIRVAEEFQLSKSGILVSSTGIGIGEKETLSEFPSSEKGKRFLNAKAFVGTVEKIHGLLKEFPEEEDLQNLLTKAYLKSSLRKKFNIKIDHTSIVFQNLNGATGDLEMRFVGKDAYLQNSFYKTVPIVILGDEKTNSILNTYGSYLARAWQIEDGCRECWDNMLSLDEVPENELALVTLAVFIEKPTPFLREFFLTIEELLYPKKRLHLFVHNAILYHHEEVDEWFSKIKEDFNTTAYFPPEEKSMKEWHAKNAAVDFCLERDCSYVLFMDSEGRLDNPYSLKLLIEQNRNAVAPMLPRPGKAWSNFWGALTADGFYSRSEDYMDIVQNEKRGLWNVPYIGSVFLLKRSLLEDPKTKPSFIHNLLDPDMAFSSNMRDQGVFLYVTNRMDFGHLVKAENFNIMNKNPNLWQMFENRWDWEKAYLHENYSQSLNESNKISMPCPDVYWFPVFKERYAEEFIDTMESYGQWSDGSNLDKRLEGGYENVPTVDIHMNQINYNDEWHEILRAYIQPLQLRVYDGYFNDVGPPRALMSFVVRYKPDEQPLLKPHHDTSTYTINVGLNRPGIDYQGGGCRFLRYNCSVIDTRVGWTLMHPGRLTHLHEGLRVTSGTRYIVVTFVDP